MEPVKKGLGGPGTGFGEAEKAVIVSIEVYNLAFLF
jgi:hypothetical protein